MPQMIPDRINSKLKSIFYITFKFELIPKRKFFINLFYTFQIKSCLIKPNLKRQLSIFFSNILRGMRINTNKKNYESLVYQTHLRFLSYAITDSFSYRLLDFVFQTSSGLSSLSNHSPLLIGGIH